MMPPCSSMSREGYVDDAQRQHFGHGIEFFWPDGVFKARRRRLGGQIESRQWIAVEHRVESLASG